MQDPPLDVYSSPNHSAVFSSPHRKYSNTGHPSFGSSSSSLDHSILNGVPANNNSNGNNSSHSLSNKMRPAMIYDDGVRFAQSCQTEMLPSCYTNKNQNQINIQMLAAELDASRDLNRKVTAYKLSSVSLLLSSVSLLLFSVSLLFSVCCYSHSAFRCSQFQTS